MRTITRSLAVLGLLSCLASAQPAVSAVVNGVSYDAVVSPGCWVTIFGSNLAPSAMSASGVPLPLVLGGVSVSVAGVPSPLGYVSPSQINALIPFEVAIPANAAVPLVVTAPDGSNSTYNVRLTRNAPALFTRNGTGTGRAQVFDANFRAVDTVGTLDSLILYATGLGPTDPPSDTASGGSGQVVDDVEVYIGDQKAIVQFAGLAPGFPGVYQLNVIAPVLATDRLYLRVGGWQSNVVDIGIRAGSNTANVKGSINALFPSSGGCADPSTACGTVEPFSIMLHAATFSVSLDILPAADPFMIAAVGEAGGSVIFINPGAGAYTALITTLTPAGAVGDFSQSPLLPLFDYSTCDPASAQCSQLPNGVIPQQVMDPLWVAAAQQLPSPSTQMFPSGNASVLVSDSFNGSGFVIDAQNNTLLSTFGGMVQIPYGPLDKRVATFKLYVDGRLIDSKNLSYPVIHR